MHDSGELPAWGSSERHLTLSRVLTKRQQSTSGAKNCAFCIYKLMGVPIVQLPVIAERNTQPRTLGLTRYIERKE